MTAAGPATGSPGAPRPATRANAFAFGQLFDERPTDREALAMRRFNDFMPTVEELHSVIVPLGDGLWVGVRR